MTQTAEDQLKSLGITDEKSLNEHLKNQEVLEKGLETGAIFQGDGSGVQQSAAKSPPEMLQTNDVYDPTPRDRGHGITPSQNVPESPVSAAAAQVPGHFKEMEQMSERLKVSDQIFKALLKIMNVEVSHDHPGMEQAMAVLAGTNFKNGIVEKLVNSLTDWVDDPEDRKDCASQLTKQLLEAYYIMDALEYRKLQEKQRLEALKAPKVS